MSCYHPLTGVWTGYTETGKKKIDIVKFVEPDKKAKLDRDGETYFTIPCGKCIGCRLDYSRSWADRMMLELETAGCGVFVTLTYANDGTELPPTYCKFDEFGLPTHLSLNKDDVQKFMKRLRKHFSDKRIRFYLAGEYGENTQRPHYHAILFGLQLSDFSDLQSHGRNEIGQNYYISDTLANIWKHGFVLLSDVSWKTCAYVARYVTKKVRGDIQLVYELNNQLSEFSLMSRKPGIGKEYLDLHPECLDFQNINIVTPEGGVKIQIPKYFLRQLELTDPERYDLIKKERRKFADDKALIKLSKTDLSYLELLEAEENAKLKKIKSLKRK